MSRHAADQTLQAGEDVRAYGVEISRKTMDGWRAQWAAMPDFLFDAPRQVPANSKLIGTDDTTVEVLDRKPDFTRRHGNAPGRRRFFRDSEDIRRPMLKLAKRPFSMANAS